MEFTNTVYTKTGTLRYLLKGSVILFASGIAANLFVTLFSMIIPQVLSFTIDSVIGDSEVPAAFYVFVNAFGGIDNLKNNLWIPALAVAVLALLSGIFTYLRMYLTTRANQTFLRRTRNVLFSHIQRLPLIWHVEHRTGDIIQR